MYCSELQLGISTTASNTEACLNPVAYLPGFVSSVNNKFQGAPESTREEELPRMFQAESYLTLRSVDSCVLGS